VWIARNKIVEEFHRIKELGFVPARRSHNTGIGKTFEDHLGVDENNRKDPDFEGFEVKSQRDLTGSKITLFTKSPTHPPQANAFLKEMYGTPDSKFPEVKVLHTSCFSNKFNSHASGYGFRLLLDRRSEQLQLCVKNLESGRPMPDPVFWSFEDLRTSVIGKLGSLFVVYAETNVKRKKEYFHFVRATVHLDFQFESFLDAIDSAHVMFDVRIGAYKTRGRKNFGKPHDHGSGFRVDRSLLPTLYRETIEVE
jgi:hypothetical protein